MPSMTFTAQTQIGTELLPAVTTTTNPQVTITGTGLIEKDIAFVATTVDQHTLFSVPITGMIGLVINSSQDITLCTNAAHSGSPAQTLTIKAAAQTTWFVNQQTTNPITVAITDFYITPGTPSVPTANAGTFNIRALYT